MQIGKDGVLRLLNLANLSGQGGPRHVGGELATIRNLPWVLTRTLAWRDPDSGQTSIFVANGTVASSSSRVPSRVQVAMQGSGRGESANGSS